LADQKKGCIEGKMWDSWKDRWRVKKRDKWRDRRRGNPTEEPDLNILAEFVS
jgi:hypothetical protein